MNDYNEIVEILKRNNVKWDKLFNFLVALLTHLRENHTDWYDAIVRLSNLIDVEDLEGVTIEFVEVAS